MTKPASTAFAKALPNRDGRSFRGQFALPGLVPAEVMKDGVVQKFPTAEAAEAAAALALVAKLAQRTRVSVRKHDYNRMSGSELATALANAELLPSDFARIYGVPQTRVMGWIDGAQEIPHSAFVLVRLLAHPDNLQEAVRLTNEATRGDAQHDA